MYFLGALSFTSRVHIIKEKADVSTADISKTQQLRQKLSGWMKSATVKRRSCIFDLGLSCYFQRIKQNNTGHKCIIIFRGTVLLSP